MHLSRSSSKAFNWLFCRQSAGWLFSHVRGRWLVDWVKEQKPNRVYKWEARGKNICRQSGKRGSCLHLLLCKLICWQLAEATLGTLSLGRSTGISKENHLHCLGFCVKTWQCGWGTSVAVYLCPACWSASVHLRWAGAPSFPWLKFCRSNHL